MRQTEMLSSPVDASSFQYLVGRDIGSQVCSFCALKPDKSQALGPLEFPNAMAGFTLVDEK
jgi:hypothetical protein